MDNFVILEGHDLEDFLHVLRRERDRGPYRVCVTTDSRGVQVKVNEGTWTVPLGTVAKSG